MPFLNGLAGKMHLRSGQLFVYSRLQQNINARLISGHSVFDAVNVVVHKAIHHQPRAIESDHQKVVPKDAGPQVLRVT